MDGRERLGEGEREVAGGIYMEMSEKIGKKSKRGFSDGN